MLENPKVTPSELGRQLGRDRASVHHVIKKLREVGGWCTKIVWKTCIHCGEPLATSGTAKGSDQPGITIDARKPTGDSGPRRSWQGIVRRKRRSAGGYGASMNLRKRKSGSQVREQSSLGCRDSRTVTHARPPFDGTVPSSSPLQRTSSRRSWARSDASKG